MRLLWHSNAPWAPTGYGVQTALACERLAAAGHQVAVSAFYGLNGSALDWQGIRVYPSARDPYGNDVVHGHALQHFAGQLRGGLTVSLVDAWILDPHVWAELNHVAWVPVDHDPIPPRVLHALKASGAVPLAMSRHGERLLTHAGLEPLYCPHMIDTAALRPMGREAARARTGLPMDAFVVGMVAANKGTPPRKSFPEAFEAFARLLKDKPNAILYLHTEALGQQDGVNLPALLKHLGIPPEAVRFCDQYRYLCLPTTSEAMAAVYGSMDVLLNPSAGEGFGVPIVEAQACGTPVIVSDFTAMTELCGAGWKVGGQRAWTYQESFMLKPDVDEIAWALRSAYDVAAGLRDDAREFALSYDTDHVMETYMLPALGEAERRHQARANGLQAVAA